MLSVSVLSTTPRTGRIPIFDGVFILTEAMCDSCHKLLGTLV